ncbi:MAG: leucine-rich repeat protein, partial [Acutalibacteraceae bacterium]
MRKTISFVCVFTLIICSFLPFTSTALETSKSVDSAVVSDSLTIQNDKTEENSQETIEPTQSVDQDESTDENERAGDNLSFMFEKETGTLVIMGEGKIIDDYTRKSAPWYTFASEIKCIDLTKAVNLEVIGKYSFADLYYLTTVKYPKTLKIISEGAFQSASSLQSFGVSESVESIGKDAFKDSGLKKITFKNKYTSVYASSLTLPKEAKIYAHNPSKAYNYAVKYKRSTYIFLRMIKHTDVNEILMIGEKYQCTKTTVPKNASNKKVVWHTTNKNIASVNSKGIVKAKKKGICYIYSKSQGNSKIKSQEKIKIIVTDLKISKNILTNNKCYKECRAISPKGIVVHSTGVNSPYATTYVRDWNTKTPGGREVCVHGFLGKNSKGKVGFYQTLPFNMASWGVGKGEKGSYNYNPGYIQFECCEDSMYSSSYFHTIYDKATDICAYL